MLKLYSGFVRTHIRCIVSSCYLSIKMEPRNLISGISSRPIETPIRKNHPNGMITLLYFEDSDMSLNCPNRTIEGVSLPLEKAIDVGCGGGQSTKIFAPYFKKVEGIDPSEVQVIEANEDNTFPNITYRVGYAEKIDCADSSAQLVTASQASHWFDLPKFYAEVNRILVPGGVLALFGYLQPAPKHKNQLKNLSLIVEKMFNKVVWDYVHPLSKQVFQDQYTIEKFTNIPFIKDPLVRDEFIMTKSSCSVDDLVGYVVSLSGFQKLERHLGEAAVSKVIQDLQSELMDAIDTKLSPNEVKIDIEYKYFLMMARKPRKQKIL